LPGTGLDLTQLATKSLIGLRNSPFPVMSIDESMVGGRMDEEGYLPHLHKFI
jgi:hypothetical protein